MLTANAFKDMRDHPILATNSLKHLDCWEGTSLEDVLTKTDPQYIQLPVPCQAPTCQAIDPETWNRRLRGTFEQVEETVQKIITAYVELGYEYHNVIPAARARCANEKICKLTHQQFGIERCGIDKDPFFAPLRKINNLTMQTHVLNNPAMMKPSVIKVLLQTLNGMRANAAVLSALVDDFATGVQHLQEVELSGHFVKQENRLPGIHERDNMRRLNRTILPTMLFEQVVRRKWRSRVRGLLEFLGQQPRIRFRRNTRWNP